VYENRPADDDEILFSWDAIQKVMIFGDPHGYKGRMYGYCDPAKSKSRKGDYAVILIGARDANKKMNVVAGMAFQAGSLTRIAKYIVDYYIDYGPFIRFGIETNGVGAGLPEILERMVKDRGAYRFKWAEVHHSTDKRIRIEGVQPAVENQRVGIHQGLQFLIDNMRDYPDVMHDDPLDGLAGLLETAETSAQKGFVGAGVRFEGRDVMGSNQVIK
jgi:predicted phage terminase large subunit-like protein